MIISDKAKQLLHESIICDNQFAIELAMPFEFETKWEMVDRFAQSGFTCLNLSLANEENTFEMTTSYVARALNFLSFNKDKYMLAKTAEDILQAKREKKLALRFMFQGTPINKNLNMVEFYYQLGITSMIISYNIKTSMGDGCIEKNDGGLSILGRNLIKEMNRVGMLIDCAHTGYKTTMETMECSQKPVIVSHANAYALCPIPRNLKDDQLKMLAKSGGFIGIDGINVILGQEQATLDKFVDHIDYIAQLIGPEYIALGLDHLYFPNEFNTFAKNQPVTNPSAYVAMANTAPNLNSIAPEQIAELIDQLFVRGYSKENIKGILGENSLRVIRNA
jgi:membrane dipeptidase